MGVAIQSLTETLTGSAPSAATEGVPLDGVKSYRIILAAPEGETLSGAGAARFWHWNADFGWAPNPSLDVDLTMSGVRAVVIAERELGPAVGRMRVVLDGVTESTGTTAQVRYELETR